MLCIIKNWPLTQQIHDNSIYSWIVCARDLIHSQKTINYNSQVPKLSFLFSFYQLASRPFFENNTAYYLCRCLLPRRSLSYKMRAQLFDHQQNVDANIITCILYFIDLCLEYEYSKIIFLLILEYLILCDFLSLHFSAILKTTQV